MSHLNFGILGAADIAKRYMGDALNKCDKSKLIGVAARDFDRAKIMSEQFNIKAYESYEALILDQNINAVYIPLPIGLHSKWAKFALENNKHVLCEKSLSGTYADIVELVNLAKKKKLVLVENFMCEHHTQNKFLQAKILSGEIGSVHTSFLNFGFPPLKDTDLKYNKELSGGALNDAGAYCLKMMCYYLKKNPKSIWANFSKLNKEVDVRGNVNVLFEDDTVANLSFGFIHDYKNEALFWGEKGSLFIDRCFSIPPDRLPLVQLTKNTVTTKYDLEACNHFIKQIENFYQLTESNETEENYNAILLQAKLMEASRLSNKEKRVVFLSEFN